MSVGGGARMRMGMGPPPSRGPGVEAGDYWRGGGGDEEAGD
jgi:hypothetical protein